MIRPVAEPKILLVDDHKIVRQGVRGLLQHLRPKWSISEAQDSVETLDFIETAHVDLIVMDVTLPGANGLQVASLLRSQGFKQPILMLTMHNTDQLRAEARKAGAQGYVVKSQAAEDLVNAIDVLLAGSTFFGVAS